MKTTQQFNITLPIEMAAVIESKIKSGAYATVSDVVGDGVRALVERDASVEQWLLDVVGGHAEYLADPSKAVPAETVLSHIKSRHRTRGEP